MLDRLRHFLRYDDWANRRAIESVRTVPAANAKALRPLAHLLIAELGWIERMLGDNTRSAFWPAMSLDECIALADELQAKWSDFVASSTEDAGGVVVSYRNSRGEPFHTPQHEIFAHLLTHGAHHRGQVLHLVREEGGAPITTDYIVFVREVEQQP